MTTEQVAINHRALVAAAAQLERIGYTGDAFRLAEALVRSAVAEGYREIPKPTPLTGPGSSDHARRILIDEIKRELDDRKRKRATVDPNGDTR